MTLGFVQNILISSSDARTRTHARHHPPTVDVRVCTIELSDLRGHALCSFGCQFFLQFHLYAKSLGCAGNFLHKNPHSGM